MTDTPKKPDEFTDTNEIQQYLRDLREHIESLESHSVGSEKDRRELKQKLDDLEQRAPKTNRGSPTADSLLEAIENIRQRVEEFEQEYLSGDSDTSSIVDSETADKFSEATGYDISQDVE